MSTIKIEWLHDDHDCETCGPTYAEGARVWIDDELIEDFLPSAHCCAGASYNESEVYHFILTRLGHKIEDNY